LDKSASPMSYDHLGQPITYTYTVTNTGNVTLPGPFTVKDDKLPVVCPPTTPLAPGDSLTCTASHAVTQADLDAGSITTAGSATNGAVPAPTDAVTVGSTAAPLLSLVKSSATTSLSAPQTVTYSYVVTNADAVTLTGIALVDDNVGNTLSCP